MLSYLNKKLTLIGLLGLSSFATLHAAPLPSSFGVWDRGEAMDPKIYPYLRGTSFDAPWNEVEMADGVYDWSGLDQALKRAQRENLSLYLSFEAGPKTPNWVYGKGVPKVKTKGGMKPDSFPFYPYYLSPIYKTYYHRFLTAMADHIKSYPKEMRERVSFIQVKTGCTGDECPYKGDAIDKQYDLTTKSAEWRAFRLETFALHAKLFGKASGLNISLLLNNVIPETEDGKSDYVEEWKWATTNLTEGFGIKNGAISRGHHLSGERTSVNTFLPYLVDPKDITLFRRSEMDQTWTRPMYQLNVQLNFYWGAINALNSGQSVWDVTSGAMKESKAQGFDYSFYFFNKYAGQIYPATATAAFCALHKGLDFADKEAYPEAEFGPATRNNVQRAEKITAAYAKYGAANDDKKALLMGQVAQRGDQAGFNDAGWGIWPDNYTRLLEQIAADETSIPLWRIGGPITSTSPIYSRFGRGFEHATGKDALYFKLHDGFSQDARPKVMTITVVWYDGVAGSTWKLDYDAGVSTMKTAVTVTGKGDKQWHHEAVTINDAVFRQGGIKGSDFALINTDDKDDVFSLVEVNRGEQEVPALRPPTEVRAFPGFAKGTKYNNDKSKKGTKGSE